MTATQAQETKLIDPLMHDFAMPLEAAYYPLGFPVHIATNSNGILLAAEESWGRFRQMHSIPPLHMRIGVLTGGGDCPGLNAVIRAVVRKGVQVHGHDFVGFRDGWRGPMDADIVPLDVEAVRGLLPRGEAPAHADHRHRLLLQSFRGTTG